MTKDQIIEAMARAIFIRDLGEDAAGAWDAPGEGGRAQWKQHASAALDAAFPLIQALLAEQVREGMERSGFNASVRDEAARLIEGATL